MSTADTISRRSTLLAALPQGSRDLLSAHLEPITCELRRQLFGSGEPMRFVYFPTSGWASMIQRLSDGRAAEVGLVGREGMVGLPVLRGPPVPLLRPCRHSGGGSSTPIHSWESRQSAPAHHFQTAGGEARR